MELNKLLEIQKEFDISHHGRKQFFEEITENNIEVLEHLIVCLVGELGEFSNIVKKISRGDFMLSDVREELSLELADMSIYLFKIFLQLGIDPEKAILEKIDINKNKFKHYE